MKVTLKPDFELTDANCQEQTGKTLSEWIAKIEAMDSPKRRDVIHELYDEMGRGSTVWWPTTIWVEYERKNNILKKDGLLEGYNICSTKTVSASVSEIYKAFTSDIATKWLGVEELAVVDGTYSDDGGNEGTWLRLREDKDIRLDWKTKGVDTVTRVDGAFVDKGKGKTLITIQHNRIQTRDEADGLRDAWGKALDELKILLES